MPRSRSRVAAAAAAVIEAEVAAATDAAREARRELVRVIREESPPLSVDFAIVAYASAVIRQHDLLTASWPGIAASLDSQALADRLWVQRMLNAHTALRNYSLAHGLDRDAFTNRWELTLPGGEPEVCMEFWVDPPPDEMDAIHRRIRVTFAEERADVRRVRVEDLAR